MRRILFLLGVCAVGAVVALMARRAVQVARTAPPEITLTDGTVLRVEGLTWGTNQSMAFEPAWWTKLKQALPNRWRRLTGPPRPPRDLFGQTVSHLWWSHANGAPGTGFDRHLWLLTTLADEGVEFRSEGWTSFGSGAETRTASRFAVLDWRADPLRFQLRNGAVTQEFVVPNPRREERFPVWKPEGLPQTRTSGGFEFVLEGVQAVGTARSYWKPTWTVRRSGQVVNEWFSFGQVFVDPTGNRAWSRLPASEPVIRVELTAYPAAGYPFAADDLVPLGPLRLPGPGQWALVPLSAAATNACLRWAAVTGTGSFGFRDGTNWLAGPKPTDDPGGSANLGEDAWEFTGSGEHPRLELLLQGPLSGGRLLGGQSLPDRRLLARARRPDGTLARADVHTHAIASGSTALAQFVRVEFFGEPAGQELELDLALVAPVRPPPFTVAAPAAE